MFLSINKSKLEVFQVNQQIQMKFVQNVVARFTRVVLCTLRIPEDCLAVQDTITVVKVVQEKMVIGMVQFNTLDL